MKKVDLRRMEIVRSRYEFGKTLAVMMNTKSGEPHSVITTYIQGESETLPNDEAFVDVNGLDELEKQLEEAGIAVRVDKFTTSGFKIYQAMKFKLDKIRDLEAVSSAKTNLEVDSIF